VCQTYWATQFEAVRQVFFSGLHHGPGGKPARRTHREREAAAASSSAASAASAAFSAAAADAADAAMEEEGYCRSLSTARPWNAQGGKSGATFLKTHDGRFVVKQITRTELQMFLEYAGAYFEYLSKAFFHACVTFDRRTVEPCDVCMVDDVLHRRTN